MSLLDLWLKIGCLIETQAVCLERVFGTDDQGYFRGPAVMWQAIDGLQDDWYAVLERLLDRDRRLMARKYDKLGPNG